MPLPHALGRFNKVVTNRISRPVARWAPGLGIVVHTGRKSGTEYRTPVNVFRREGGYALALTYGEGAQWVRNVLAAGEAEVVNRGHTHAVTNPRIVVDPERRAVPWPVGQVLRLLSVDHFLLVDDQA
jgi:deazaflavin-dependent oxidoreductase (nitroreductase family)